MTSQGRVRTSFTVLVVVVVVAVGVLGKALAWPASPLAGLTVAGSGLIAVIAGGLALRILFLVDRR